MIAESVINRIRARYEVLCRDSYEQAKAKMPRGKPVRQYALSNDAQECREILLLAQKADLTQDEEARVKAYHLRYCIVSKNLVDLGGMRK